MKKLFNLLICLMIVFSSVLSINTVQADDNATLRADTILIDMFDLSPLTIAHVGHLSVEDSRGTTNAWCIEPDVLTHLGDNYIGTIYNDSSSNQNAGRQILYRWYLYYQGNDLYNTSAGYYAVQLAIWGKIKSYDPGNLTITNSNNGLAERVRSLASDLYNDSRDTSFGIASHNFENEKTYTTNNDDYIYFYKGVGYYRSEKMWITTKNSYNLKFHVSVDNDGFITNSKNKIVSSGEEFSAYSGNGTIFYVYTPISATSKSTVTITGSYEHFDMKTWDFVSGRYGFGQRMVSLESKTEPINLKFYYDLKTIEIPEIETEYTGTISLTKKGQGVVDYSISTVNGETLYTIQSGEVGLENSYFALFVNDGNDNLTPYDKKAYLTDSSGSLNLENIPLTFDGNNKASYVICEIEPSEGYSIYKTTQKNSSDVYYSNVKTTEAKGTSVNLLWDFDGTNGHSYACFKTTFNKNNANSENAIVAEFNAINEPKHFNIHINKTVDGSATLSGYQFGIYSTLDITTSSGKTIPAGSLVSVITTDSNGDAELNSNINYLPADQDYIVKEFGNYDVEYTFNKKTTYDEVVVNISEQTTSDAGYTIAVKNTLAPDSGSLTVKKLGETENGGTKVLNDVTFNLSGEKGIFTATTDSNGEAKFDNIPIGIYTLTETGTATGYVIAASQDITITKNSNETVTVTNYLGAKQTLVVKKQVTSLNEGASASQTFNVNIYKGSVSEANLVKTLTLKNGESVEYSFYITEAGTQKYIIKEDTSNRAEGYTYDSKEYSITYTSTVSNGKATVAKVETDGFEADNKTVIIKNVYDQISDTISVKKIAVNNPNKNKEFTIEIYKDGQLNSSQKVKENGTLNITSSFKEPGTYTYTIKEKDESDNNWTYDKEVYTITYIVSKNSEGKLSFEKTVKNSKQEDVSAITFTNVFTPTATKAEIQIKKEVSNLTKEQVGNDKFEFEIFSVDSTTKEETSLGSVFVDRYSEKNGNIAAFKTSDLTLAKTYTYKIKEKSVAENYIETTRTDKTGEEFTVKVKVEQDGENLKVSQTDIYNKDGEKVNEVKFVNTYDIPDGEYDIGKLKLNKKQANVSLLDSEEFKVKVVVKKDNEVISETEYNYSDKEDLQIPIVVKNIGTYTYEISEVDTGIKDWTYDKSTYSVSISAVQSGKGVKLGSAKLNNKELSVNENVIETGISFKNTFNMHDELEISFNINKTTDVETDEKFIALVDNDEVEISTDEITKQVEKITDVGTYNFVIEEKNTESKDWKYDTSYYVVNAKVSQENRKLVLKSLTAQKYILNSDGKYIAVDVENFNNDKLLTFSNYYNTKPVTEAITIRKDVNGTNLADTFEFTIKDENGETTTLSRDGKGTVSTSFTFDKEGTYNYTIKEVNKGYDGYTFDESVYKLTYVVEKDGKEYKVASKTLTKDGKEADSIVFTNTKEYKPVSVSVKINKKFNISDTEAKNLVSEFNVNDKKVSISGNGSKTLTYSFDKPGTYTYKISEVKGIDSKITYDISTYTLVVNVTESKNGLVVEQNLTEVTFNNKYTYEKLRVYIPIVKALTGDTTDAKDFIFQVDDKDAATIKGAGSINYYKEFTTPGDYTYTISEKNSGYSGWTFDTSKYIVKVHVYVENGALKATTSITKNGTAVNEIKFTNKYTKTTQKETPKEHKVPNTSVGE